ncbi:MAG: hypothetical protein WC205_19280 [Opitutaceae bacterium]|jgi:hypothetical protein
MKTKLTLASLLLAAISSPLFADSIAVPGKTGDVTLALVTAYEDGGFIVDGETNDTKTIASSDTFQKSQYKTVIKKGKLSNTEYIALLIDRDFLYGNASDWVIQYVKADGGVEGYLPETMYSYYFNGGCFAVNASEEDIVFLGDFDGDNSEYGPDIATDYTMGYISSESSTTTTKIDGYTSNSVETGSYKDSFVAYFTIGSGSFGPKKSRGSALTGINNIAGSYKNTYTSVEGFDPLGSETYKVSASSITGIVGGDYGSQTSGTIKISALKDAADVQSYVNAYINFVYDYYYSYYY